MKIVSVLIYPYENRFVARVTRAEDYFSFPQKSKLYNMPYDSSLVKSFFEWSQKLARLNEEKLFNTLRRKYNDRRS